jgi:Predicted ATP-binding protein involved in virulence
MKLISVSVTGLFNMFDHSLELGDRLTFIHSPNGYGKSTFVRMITMALKGDVEGLLDIPFQRMDLNFSDETNLIIESENGELRVQMQRNEIESEISEDDMRSILDVLYITSDRLNVKKLDGRIVPALEAYASEFADRLRTANEDNELQIEKISKCKKEVGDDEIVFRSKDLKAKLDFMKDAGFEPEMPAGYRFPPSRNEVNDFRDDYIALAHAVSEYVKRNYVLAESIVVFRDILNGLLIGKNAYVNEIGTIGIEFDDGTALPLNKLSSGEKQLMIIFYNLLFHALPGSLVVIDEPEISLHISWQQKMGSILMDVARLRDLQMIVATHSPQIVHDKWDMANELRVERD